MKSHTVHVPVLLHEVIDILALAADDVVVDATAGGGGHAEAILQHLGPNGRYIAIDQDAYALERVRTRLGDDARVQYVEGNFRAIAEHVAQCNLDRVDKVLLDLGLSSDQLDVDTQRGFSFQRDEPLVMTFAATPGEASLTAARIVNEWDEDALANVLYGYGEERSARKIARAIVEARAIDPIETTIQLADVVASVKRAYGPRHPATQTFQALRIAVNDEFGALEAGLAGACSVLAPSGRVAVISFHSAEDRIVKHMFRSWAADGLGQILTKHPIAPAREEQRQNRRARSAKLRAFERSV